MDAYIGEIRLFPFTFYPSNWLPCDGRPVPITSNSALFSILGTQFGGNGATVFNLPLLQNYSAVGTGAGVGLTPYTVGQVNGTGVVNLITSQIPSHTHVTQAGNVATSPTNNTNVPATSVLLSNAYVNASGTTFTTRLYATSTDNTTLAPNTIGPPVGATGSGHDNHQPYLALQYCICVQGIYPSRG